MKFISERDPKTENLDILMYLKMGVGLFGWIILEIICKCFQV